MVFVLFFQSTKDFDGIGNTWFIDINFLEPACQGAVFFKPAPELFIGR